MKITNEEIKLLLNALGFTPPLEVIPENIY